MVAFNPPRKKADVLALRASMNYDPETGLMTRLNGAPAGFPTRDGYMSVNFQSKKWLVHSLVWAWVHGNVPDGLEIDHINQVRTDNRIANLRLVTRTENMANRTIPKYAPGGVVLPTGVSYNRGTERYVAHICVNRKHIHLGSFTSPDEAIEARARVDGRA